jgi:hypothetical protein
MTTTILRTGATTTPTSSTDVLRVLIDDALSVAADDAADRYSSRTSTGRTLLSLAALARRAAGALGVESGAPLTAGPGVVVQREVATAARLLDAAAEGADGEPPDIDGLLVAARGLHARLLESASTRR